MKRLLIVEDEPLISSLLQDWLIELGFDVLGPAETVDAAFDLLQTTVPDAAILDVTLAQGTSYPLADALVLKSIPVAFATGHGSAGVHPRFTACPTLTKPYDFEGVQRLVSDLQR